MLKLNHRLKIGGGGNLLKALITDVFAGGNRLFHCGEIKLSQCHSELVSGCQAGCTAKYPLLEERDKVRCLTEQVRNIPVIANEESLSERIGEFPSPMEEGLGERVLPFAMLAVNDIIKKCAFTLAEVLITLGIIGVVAAITIPSLMAATQEASLVPKVKKTYSTLAQALKLASNDYDTPGDFSLIFEEGKSATQITKELATYINGARYCDAGSSAKGCSDLNYKIKYASLIKNGDSNTALQSSQIINSPRIVLMDGTVIAITSQGRGCGDYEASGDILNNGVNTGNKWHQIRSNCGEIFFDVNGPKRPNQFGVDSYGINVYQNSLGFNYWSAYGTNSLRNILNNVKHPFQYSKYSDSQEFEW